MTHSVVTVDSLIAVGDMAYEVALFAAQAERDLPGYLEPARLATADAVRRAVQGTA